MNVKFIDPKLVSSEGTSGLLFLSFSKSHVGRVMISKSGGLSFLGLNWKRFTYASTLIPGGCDYCH